MKVFGKVHKVHPGKESKADDSSSSSSSSTTAATATHHAAGAGGAGAGAGGAPAAASGASAVTRSPEKERSAHGGAAGVRAGAAAAGGPSAARVTGAGASATTTEAKSSSNILGRSPARLAPVRFFVLYQCSKQASKQEKNPSVNQTNNSYCHYIGRGWRERRGWCRRRGGCALLLLLRNGGDDVSRAGRQAAPHRARAGEGAQLLLLQAPANRNHVPGGWCVKPASQPATFFFHSCSWRSLMRVCECCRVCASFQ